MAISSKELSQKTKIMIVDDDPAFRRSLREVFEPYGFEIHEAGDSSKALVLARRYRPSLVLLDIKLAKGESGFDLCKELRTIQNDGWRMKIVMLSILAETHFKISGYHSGADGYFAKPFDLDELIAFSQALLRQHLPSDQKGNSLSSSPIALSMDDGSKRIEKFGFKIDLYQQKVWYKEKLLQKISAMGIKILVCLLKHSPNVVTKKIFMKEIWVNELTLSLHKIQVHIYNLKKSLPSQAASKIINIPKEGYQIRS